MRKLIAARARKNKRTARIFANVRKDHSIPLAILLVFPRLRAATPLCFVRSPRSLLLSRVFKHRDTVNSPSTEESALF